MGDLTKNLSQHEFQCRCSDYCDDEGVVSPELYQNIQEARDKAAKASGLNLRIYISSPNRCHQHNINEGGAPKSKHLYGLAADFWFYVGSDKSRGRIDMWKIYQYMDDKYKGKHGLAFYKNSAGKTRIHYDVAKRFWRKNYAK